MNDIAKIALGLTIPLLGTVLGSATVFFLRGEMNERLKKALLGFAAGVMTAASVWSLLLPSIEMARENGTVEWLPACVGFLFGIVFLLVLDTLIPHLHASADKPEGHKSSLGKSLMLFLAVTLHNVPEGMVVGVVFAGVLNGSTVISAASAFALAIGIALQNFPEGAVLSMPLVSTGMSKKRAFGYGALSGVVEPLGALLTIALTSFITPALPYILSFAAGAMIYVVVEELIPESQAGEHSNVATVGVALGFALMMVLDIAFG